MHVTFGTALVVAALVASAILVLPRGDRLFPALAVVAAGIEALIAFGIIVLASRSFRVDVILPALLAVAGVVSWARVTSKVHVSAATVVTVVGLIQLLLAVRLLR